MRDYMYMYMYMCMCVVLRRVSCCMYGLSKKSVTSSQVS